MGIDYTKRPAPSTSSAPAGPVSLTKAAPSVSLTKSASRGRLQVNLNWDARPAPSSGSGFLGRLTKSSPAIDLDLGCLYELTSGMKGVVQALGNAFGALDREPFVHLDGDDRSGTVTSGENLFVNLAHADKIRRVLVFACIYDGAPSFDQANGVVTLTPVDGPEITVRLDGTGGQSRMCAIAMIENTGSGLVVNRLVNYVSGSQRELDQAYGWGMNWTTGRK